jgi:hypothetical protein
MKIELTEDQIDGVVYDALMTLEENNPTDGRVLQALKPNRRKLHKAIKRVLSVQFSYETGLLADRQYENDHRVDHRVVAKTTKTTKGDK